MVVCARQEESSKYFFLFKILLYMYNLDIETYRPTKLEPSILLKFEVSVINNLSFILIITVCAAKLIIIN